MKEYTKPRLLLGETLTLLGEDYEEVTIVEDDLQGHYRVLFTGTLRELRHEGDNKDIPRLLERTTVGVNFNDEEVYVIYVNKEVTPPYCFHEFPKKPMRVVEMLHFLDKKEEVILVQESDLKELYNGRMEYLQYTGDGVLDDLCMREVSWFEAINRDNMSKIRIFLEDEESEKE